MIILSLLQNLPDCPLLMFPEKEKYIVLGAPNNNPDNPEKYIHRQIPVDLIKTYYIDRIRQVLDKWGKKYEDRNNNSKRKDGD